VSLAIRTRRGYQKASSSVPPISSSQRAVCGATEAVTTSSHHVEG
jgi:hypothetical protein